MGMCNFDLCENGHGFALGEDNESKEVLCETQYWSCDA